MYGNDFIHDVDSIDVGESFIEVIHKYAEVLKSNKKHFVEFKKGSTKKKINIKFLVDVLDAFQQREETYLRDRYLKDTYINYKKFKNIMGVNKKGNLNEELGNFMKKAKEFINDIMTNDIAVVANKWKTDGSFFYKFRNLVRVGSKFISNEEFIKKYSDEYKRSKKIPQMGVLFKKRIRTINDSYQVMKLQKSLDSIDEGLRITPYDEELFKFNERLDEYKDKMNQKNIDLGYISISPESFVFKTDDINKSIKKFYKSFFGIDDMDTSKGKMNKLVSDYIEGFVWCFEYYFNNYNIEDHHKNAHTWFFDHARSPLIKQIHEFMLSASKNSNYLEDVAKILGDKFVVSRERFFSVIEQMMYVSPVQVKSNNVPEEYTDFVKKNKYYIDMKKMADDFWKGSGGVIDCRGAMFLSQCHLDVSDFSQSFEKDIVFIDELRKIKLTKNAHRDKKYSDKIEVNTITF